MPRPLAAADRRAQILQWLQVARTPVPARDLGTRFNVSRQVIVQDIAMLRAAGHEIVATASGYMGPAQTSTRPYRQILAVSHGPERTEDELLALVDAGVRVLDVIVDHPLYGELRGILMLETRADVGRFMEQVTQHGVTLLSSLTGGLHLHTIEAEHPDQLRRAHAAMAERGYLVTDAGSDSPTL